ncbi:MAG TPA: ThuA domain-containing protein [Propionibacteriaceae bacterium]
MSDAKRALVVRGGWEGHQPVAATELFLPHLLEHGYEVRVEESPQVYADAAYLSGVDLIVQCVSMSEIAPDEVHGLRRAVAGGTGMAGWHGGIADSFRNSADYLHLIGAQFACHPGKDPDERVGDATDNFLRYAVNMLPAAAEHPVTRGIGDFELVTEQYWVLADGYLDVLATTTLAARKFDPWHVPVTAPAVWTRRWGQGRIFVATPGHDLDVLAHPAVNTILKRGMLWASR